MHKKILYGLLGAFFSLNLAWCGELFPEVPGWKFQEEKRVYNNGDLWELINGAADIFLSYDFRDLHIAEYTSNDQIIRVELYRHSTPENTFGIYTAERMPDYPQVTIGSQGYKSQGIVNFLAGNYYVKVMSAGSQEASEADIALVAEKVDKQLAQPVGLPAVLNYFPSAGKEVLSDAYIAQNFLGYSFFHSAYTMRYNQKSEFQLFIIHATVEEIRKMTDAYVKQLKEDKVKNKGELMIFDDPFNGTLFMQPKGDYLVGVVNTEDEETATAYISETIQRIP
jgi:hypothetical protein